MGGFGGADSNDTSPAHFAVCDRTPHLISADAVSRDSSANFPQADFWLAPTGALQRVGRFAAEWGQLRMGDIG
jgi:hypothetical protein